MSRPENFGSLAAMPRCALPHHVDRAGMILPLRDVDFVDFQLFRSLA